MKLVHYTDMPIGVLTIRPQDDLLGIKPRGLWVSDDDCEDNWKSWCESEGFGRDRLTLAYEVSLRPDANILVISSADGIDTFTREFAVHPYPDIHSNIWINWPAVSTRWDGMIVTPYIWDYRLSFETEDAMWYYGWDCASGCIWDPKAIASVTLREAP